MVLTNSFAASKRISRCDSYNNKKAQLFYGWAFLINLHLLRYDIGCLFTFRAGCDIEGNTLSFPE